MHKIIFDTDGFDEFKNNLIDYVYKLKKEDSKGNSLFEFNGLYIISPTICQIALTQSFHCYTPAGSSEKSYFSKKLESLQLRLWSMFFKIIIIIYLLNRNNTTFFGFSSNCHASMVRRLVCKALLPVHHSG